MLELDDPGSPVRRESVRQLSEIRGFIGGLAEEAGVDDVDGFARQWHILMKGCIVAAAEGDRAGRRRGRASSARCCSPTTGSRPRHAAPAAAPGLTGGLRYAIETGLSQSVVVPAALRPGALGRGVHAVGQ